jgi:hypothetical protein
MRDGGWRGGEKLRKGGKISRRLLVFIISRPCDGRAMDRSRPISADNRYRSWNLPARYAWQHQ